MDYNTLKQLVDEGVIDKEKFLDLTSGKKKDEPITMTIEEFDELLDKKIENAVNPLIEKINSVDNKLLTGLRQNVSVGEITPEVSAKTINLFRTVLGYEPLGGIKATDVLNEATASEGGYLVPEEFQAEVIRLVPDYGIARKECRIIPMKSRSKKLPALIAGVTAYWIGEGAKKKTSKWTLAQVELVAHKLAALVPATDELLEDTSIETFDLLTTLIAEAFAQEEDIALFQGNGGSIPGILGTEGVATVVLDGTSFSDIKPDKLLDMINAVPSAARKGAKFYINSTVLAYLQKQKTSQGNYVWQEPAGSKPGTIWNYPYVETDALPSASDSAADTAFVVFGNLKRVFFGDRKRITVDNSKEGTFVDPETGEVLSFFQNDVSALRGIERVDIKVAIPKAFSVLKTSAES